MHQINILQLCQKYTKHMIFYTLQVFYIYNTNNWHHFSIFYNISIFSFLSLCVSKCVAWKIFHIYFQVCISSDAITCGDLNVVDIDAVIYLYNGVTGCFNNAVSCYNRHSYTWNVDQWVAQDHTEYIDIIKAQTFYQEHKLLFVSIACIILLIHGFSWYTV